MWFQDVADGTEMMNTGAGISDGLWNWTQRMKRGDILNLGNNIKVCETKCVKYDCFNLAVALHLCRINALINTGFEVLQFC